MKFIDVELEEAAEKVVEAYRLVVELALADKEHTPQATKAVKAVKKLADQVKVRAEQVIAEGVWGEKEHRARYWQERIEVYVEEAEGLLQQWGK